MISPFVKEAGDAATSTSPTMTEFSTRRRGLRSPVSYWRGAASPVDQSATVTVTAESDVADARQLGREISARAGFTGGDQTVIAAAITEVARNIVTYAGKGEITLTAEAEGSQPGIVVVARDTGPGIPDVSSALREGFSTAGGAGLGLAGVRRLMDVFEIVSAPGKGTTITMQKWRRAQA
jgi:serine/threonine-protein kinase RsbT